MSKEPSAMQQMFGELAPKLVDLSDNLLLGDIWERPALAKRDRSLITVATLIALNKIDSLRFHLEIALDNGLSQEELIEVITHMAFYSGWPSAMSALALAKEVFSSNT